MALTGKWKELGDALLAQWSTTATNAGIDLGWARGMRGQPSYPCSPRTDCPRARLRVSEEGHSMAPGLGCAGQKAAFEYRYSLWVQLRQTPGEEHQTLLLAALASFRDVLLQGGFVPDFGVSGVHKLQVTTLIGAVFDELDHPLSNPALRVSTGEIRITLTGEIRSE